jgi:MFS family permease
MHRHPIDKRIFGTLFFSLFVTVTGVGIVVPLLPVYARNLGADGLYIGLIFAAFSLSRSFLLPYFGRQSDRRGRKPFIITGLFAYTLVSAAFTLVVNVEGLILIRFLQGIASAMIMPVVQAYVGDITPIGTEGLTMGLFNTSVFLGLSIGPLLGGMIRDNFDLDAAFLSMGILAAFGFALSCLLLPPRGRERVTSRALSPPAWSHILMDPEIGSLFLFRFTYTACIGVVWGFLPILADGEFSLSSAGIGLLVMLGVFTSGVIHIPMGYLADRTNRETMVIVGGLLVCGSMLYLYWSRDFWDLFWGSVVFGLGGGVSMPALMALGVVKGNRTDAMGSVMALLTMAHSLGMMTGALAAGLMMDAFRLRLAFPLGAAAMMTGTGLFWACAFRARAARCF